MIENISEVVFIPIDKIAEYENNNKVHDQAHVDTLAASIKRFGLMEPVLIDKNLTIISGHGRLRAMKQLGYKEVPTITSKITDREAIIARIAANKTTGTLYDEEAIRDELEKFFGDDGTSDADFEEALAGAGITITEVNVMLHGDEQNYDSLVEDSAKAVEDFETETEAAARESAAKPIPIAKALGFKSITNEENITVSEAMTMIMHNTGQKDPAIAFIKHCEGIVNG